MITKSTKNYNTFTLILSENGGKKLTVNVHGNKLLYVTCDSSKIYFRFHDSVSRDIGIWDRKHVQHFVNTARACKNDINKHNCPTCTLGVDSQFNIKYVYNRFLLSRLIFNFGENTITFLSVEDNFLEKLDQFLQPVLNNH